MAEVEPQERVVLVRNEDYPFERGYFDRVEIIAVGDDKTAELGVLAGDLDISTVSVSSIPDLQASLPDGFKLDLRPTTGFTWLGMNVDHEPFGDLRVRRAVQMAIGQSDIIEGAYFGASAPSTGVIAPGLEGYWDREVPAADPAGARALLAEAGLADGFSTTITTLNRSDFMAACQIIQQPLAEAGISAEILPYESGIFWDLGQEMVGEDWKNLGMIYQQWTSSPDPNRATQWFTCDMVGQWNWERWCNDEYTSLNQQAFGSVDAEERDRIYRRMMEIMWEDGAYVPITHVPQGMLYRADLELNLLPNGIVYAQRVTEG